MIRFSLFLLLTLALAPLEAESKKLTNFPIDQSIWKENDSIMGRSQISGVVSCYSPCRNGEKKCKRSMQGRDEVKYPSKCPGMKPYKDSYQKGNGYYVIAASGTLKSLAGIGAKVKVEGIPGIGIVCDDCPGCDRFGKILDVASSNPSHRIDCPLQSERKITILETKAGPKGDRPKLTGIYDK